MFVNVNPQSTLLLGQARGTAICAAVLAGLPVAEYTALQVKQAVVGNGHAAKEQVQDMVRRLLALPGDPAPDAADALACAICHAHGGQGLGARDRRLAHEARAGWSDRRLRASWSRSSRRRCWSTCGGVAYELDVPMSTFYSLPATGEAVTPATRTWSCARTRTPLYGFATRRSARVFRQLIRISGVGARTALSVLSA